MIGTNNKNNVYIHQFNTPSSRALIPLSAGLLKSYAIAIPEIRDDYNIHIEVRRDTAERVVNEYDHPAILAFSTYFWNFNQSVQVAKYAKNVYPDALIVFGGPMVPVNNDEIRTFLLENQFVDIAVSGEGEIAFSKILLRLINGKNFSKISGVSYRDEKNNMYCADKIMSINDFSNYPSPFLDGVFDDLVKRNHNFFSGVLLETNRGCPFSCSYCYWGGEAKKVTKFPMKRVFAELDWIVDNKFEYISGVDANFGILDRDLEIAEYMANLNNKRGYPKYLAINWTKGITDKIFRIVDTLSNSKIQFMLTASFQSHNPDTLKAVNRLNIMPAKLDGIIEKLQERGIDVYSELILALPLETYQSFVNGIGKALLPALNYHFNLYYFYLIPGSEMSRPEYLKKYKIRTRRCAVSFERTVDKGNTVEEYEDIVVSTSTMSIGDWKKSFTFGYYAKVLYGYRLSFFIFNYLRWEKDIDLIELVEFLIKSCCNSMDYKVNSHAISLLQDLEDSILDNGSETLKIENVETNLHPEVAVLVSLLSEKNDFYRELCGCLSNFLITKDISVDYELLGELFVYQFCIIPSWKSENQYKMKFNYNFFDYFNGDKKIRKQPSFLVLGDGRGFDSIDDFLRKQIYGGMKFSLSKVEELDKDYMDQKDCEEFVEAKDSPFSFNCLIKSFIEI
jgi:radical SAM superfamily enzyme YgiQ (UPF0313 family)